MRGVAEIPVKPYRLSLFLILFYFGFVFISMLGFLFFNNIPFTFHAFFVFTLFFIFLIAGVELGKSLNFGRLKKINFSKFETFLIIIILLQTFVILGVWNIIIDRYGSLSNILSEADKIRRESIGQTESPVPVWMTYFAGTIQFSFASSLIFIEYSTKKSKYVLLSVYTFLLVLLLDLTTFGRIGTLYSFFTIIGYTLIFRKQVFTLKRISLVTIVILLVLLPRYIRGDYDAFASTVDVLSPYLKNDFHPIVLSMLTFYMYYFSSIFAMSVYYELPTEPLLYGERTFTPFYNVISRFFIEDDRIVLIDKIVYVPYPVNIYSIVKDMTVDFGYLGMTIVAFFFGIVLGNIFRTQNKGIFWDALKIFMFGWIFYIPIYNAFSFGGFLLSFIALMIPAMFFKTSISKL